MTEIKPYRPADPVKSGLPLALRSPRVYAATGGLTRHDE
jgi:hypothetical protein